MAGSADNQDTGSQGPEGDDNQNTEGQQQQEENQLNPSEEKATGNGWKPKDEWEGDPDEWVSAKKFNERGEMMGNIRELMQNQTQMRKDFDSRLSNVNKMHKAQLSQLETDKRAAIEMADVAEVEKIQGEIDELKADSQPVKDDVTESINKFNASNSWIHEDTPKTAYAKQQVAKYSNQGMNVDQAIEAMEKDIAREFPSKAQRQRAPAQETRQSSPATRRSSSKNLTMNDLTAGESRMYSEMGSAWKSEAEFLQAVKDIRAGS